MLKKMKINSGEFKGVVEKSTAKLWPFGSSKARLIQFKRKTAGDQNNSMI